MKAEQLQVREFMVKAGQATPTIPTSPPVDVRKLRVTLIAEELLELCEAFGVELEIDQGEATVYGDTYISGDADIKLAYDAILDLLVVVIGTAVAMGLNLEPGWQEVHRSNMSKFIDGHRREDGKWVKGPSYSEAKLEPIIRGMT